MNANADLNQDIDVLVNDNFNKINKRSFSRTPHASRLSVISSSSKSRYRTINDVNKRNFDIFHDVNNNDAKIISKFFNEIIKSNLENLTCVYLENFGFLIPNANWGIDYSEKDNVIIMKNEQTLSISFEKCLLLNTFFKEKYNPIEFKKLLKTSWSSKLEISKQYTLDDILKYASSFVSTLKYEVISNGVCDLLSIGTLYSVHNRQGESFKDWYSGADIVFKQKVKKTYVVKETHKYLKPVYNDALEVFEVSYGNYVEKIDINLRKELVMLGFGVDDVKNLKESSLPVYVYEDRSLSEKGVVILYYVTNSLRKFGISEYGVGTEFVFSVVLEESDFRCKNGLLNIPNWPKKAFVASWLCLEHDELRKMNNGFAIKLNAPLVEVNNEGLTGILISDFEDLSNVQMAKDGNFYYKNVLGITKSELEFANKFSVEYILDLLKERGLHQTTKINRRSIIEKTERLI